MSTRDKKLKKKKRREERLRQEKHLRRFQSQGGGMPGHVDDGPRHAEDDSDDNTPPAVVEERPASRIAYTPPVAAFLALGRPADPWPDYRRFGLTEEHLPQLAMMAVDAGLNESENAPECYAPMHAWRALGQLGGPLAAEALTAALDYCEGNDFALSDLPEALGLVGAPALPGLVKYLADQEHYLYARGAAADAIAHVGTQRLPLRDECVRLLADQLRQHGTNDSTLNGLLISYLLDLKAQEVLPLIAEAFEAENVDESIAGDLNDVKKELLSPASRKPEEK